MVKLEQQIAQKRTSQQPLNLRPSGRISKQQNQQTKLNSIASSYKSQGYEIIESGNTLTIQSPLKKIDPEYSDKFREHIITYDKSGNLLSELKYKSKYYKGAYHKYLTQSKYFSPTKGTIRERNYDIEGYSTKLRSDKTYVRETGKIISQDLWGAWQPKKQEPKNYYYNPLTESYTTQKIEGQKPVTKSEAGYYEEKYISQGYSPFQVETDQGKKQLKTAEHKQLYALSKENKGTKEIKIPIDTRQSSLATPTFSAELKKDNYFIPLKKEFDYSQIAYKPYGGNTVYPLSVKSLTPKIEKNILKRFLEYEKKPAEERREIAIEKISSGIDKVTRNIANIDLGLKQSMEAFDKSYGVGSHGTIKEQAIAIPYATISGFAQLPTFGLEIYDVVASGSMEKALKIPDEMISAYEQAPITTVGSLFTMWKVGKKARQIKETEKPLGISSKAQKGLDVVTKEKPKAYFEQYSGEKIIKFNELRDFEKIAKPGKAFEKLIDKEIATKYESAIPQKTAFILESKPSSKTKVFSVEIGDTTYQTLTKDNYMVKTEISPKGRAKIKIYETEKPKTPFGKLNEQLNKYLKPDLTIEKSYFKLLGEFEKDIEPYVKLTKPDKINLKEGFGDYPKEWDYLELQRKINYEDLLNNKQIEKIIPKEVYTQNELDIGVSKFVQVGEGKDVPVGYFITKLSSRMEARTLKPAFTSKIGKPIISQNAPTLPESIIREIHPTEYKFAKELYKKDKSLTIYTEEGEILASKEAVSSSKQLHNLKAYGEIDFNRNTVEKIKYPKIKELEKGTPLKWLKEEKPKGNLENWQNYANELSRMEGLKPLSYKSELTRELERAIARNKGHGDTAIKMIQENEAKKTKQIMVYTPDIEAPSNIYNIFEEIEKKIQPKSDIRLLNKPFKIKEQQNNLLKNQSIIKSDIRLKLDNQIKTENKITQKSFNIQLSRQIQNQIQRQTQTQKQTQIQKQIQKSIQTQIQTQKQTQIQKQIQKSIQIQQQIQQQIQIKPIINEILTPKISLSNTGIPLAIPKLKHKIKSKRKKNKFMEDLLVYSEDFTSKAIGLEPKELTGKQFEKLLKTKLTGLEIRPKLKLKW